MCPQVVKMMLLKLNQLKIKTSLPHHLTSPLQFFSSIYTFSKNFINQDQIKDAINEFIGSLNEELFRKETDNFLPNRKKNITYYFPSITLKFT